MHNLAIIPARGGSKRIPRKNIKLFLGKPIIAYSIEVALNSGLFNQVMVSTDDFEIASISKQFGAVVPFMRSEKTSSDFATTFEVLEEVITSYQEIGVQFDNVCCIYPCAPLIIKQKLVESYNLLLEEQFDSVFPIIRFGYPIQRALKLNGKRKISFFFPEFSITRSQDLDPLFHDAGQFYWINLKKFIQNGVIVTENSGCIEITEMEGQDIDNDIDWKLAELKFEILQNIK